MSNDARDVTATSKPRGSYLDPLKACSLSGENGVHVGKSESATFAKYNGIIKQSRRNASRASVLNDVERSRFESIVKRMENEHEYQTAVLDRQKRQFRKSLQVLEKDRRAVKRYFDRGGNWVATPLKLVDGVVTRKRNRPVGDKYTGTLPPIDILAAVQEANNEHAQHAKKDAHASQKDAHATPRDAAGKRTAESDAYTRENTFLSAGKPISDFPTRRIQSMSVGSRPSSHTVPDPLKRFYTGDDIQSMKGSLHGGHQKEDDGDGE